MQVVVGVALVHAGRVLAARRSYPAESAGRWEFPGGKVDAGETPVEAAEREVAEELGCRVVVTGWLAPEVRIRDDLVLRVAVADLADGEPVPRDGEHDAVRWLRADQLDDIDWLPADRPFTGPLGKRLGTVLGRVPARGRHRRRHVPGDVSRADDGRGGGAHVATVPDCPERPARESTAGT